MLQKVLPPDIGNDGNQRLGMDNVSEVLVRTHSKVGTTGPHIFLQAWNNVHIGSFVGDEVIGVEIPFRFGKALDQSAEFLPRYLSLNGSP